MRILLFVILAMLGSAAFALDTQGLTPDQLAAVQKTIDAAKQANTATPLSMASEWGTQAATAAEGFAKALGIAAREIGVTVNEFISTPAGKLTAALIVWKVAGATLVSMMYGVVVLVVGLYGATLLARHIATEKYTSVPYSRLWGLWAGERRVRVYRPFSDYSEGDILMTLVSTVIAGITLFIAGALIRP